MMDPAISLEAVRTFFEQDRFATDACKCRILEAGPGHAVCAFDIEEVHRNGFGAVMGGAVFTLADYALAIACNIGEEPTVSVSNTIEYLHTPKGTRLTATATTDRSGRSLGFYTVDVVDDLGIAVAKMTATCFRAPAR